LTSVSPAGSAAVPSTFRSPRGVLPSTFQGEPRSTQTNALIDPAESPRDIVVRNNPAFPI
jgi:hypothetical protein